MRLNKFLSAAGVCSRRKADQLITDGQVEVNGKPVTELGSVIDEKKDVVAVSYDDLTLKCNVIKPQIDIKKIVEKHINDKCLNPHEVNPIYLKLTEAEEKHKNDSKVSN